MQKLLCHLAAMANKNVFDFDVMGTPGAGGAAASADTA